MTLVLSFGVRPEFAVVYAKALAEHRIEVIHLTPSQFRDCRCYLGEPGGPLDWFAVGGRVIRSNEVIATYSEGHFASHKQRSGQIDTFLNAEAIAAIAFMRCYWGAAINPPSNGSIGPFGDSLPVQWEFVRRVLPELDTPTWSLSLGPKIPSGALVVSNPFCYQYNATVVERHAVQSENARPFVILRSPLGGAHLLVLFVGETVFAVVDNGKGWSHLPLLPTLLGAVGRCLRSLRGRFGIQVGQLELFFDGRLRFWSVSPTPCPWYLGKQQSSQFSERLAGFTMEEADKALNRRRDKSRTG